MLKKSIPGLFQHKLARASIANLSKLPAFSSRPIWRAIPGSLIRVFFNTLIANLLATAQIAFCGMEVLARIRLYNSLARGSYRLKVHAASTKIERSRFWPVGITRPLTLACPLCPTIGGRRFSLFFVDLLGSGFPYLAAEGIISGISNFLYLQMVLRGKPKNIRSAGGGEGAAAPSQR